MPLSKSTIELMHAYIGGLGLTSVRVLVGKSGEPPCRLEFSTDPGAGDPHGMMVLFDALWFSKASHGELVRQQCIAVLDVDPDAPINLPPAKVRDALVNEAANVGASWRSMQEVLSVAESAVQEIERHVQVWNQTGGLSGINKSYKRYRQLCITTMVSAIGYSAYLHTFKLKVVHLIGQNTAAGVERFSGVAELKPDALPQIKRRDHLTNTRDEKLNDLAKTGRSYVMPGWTHPNQFPRREATPKQSKSPAE